MITEGIVVRIIRHLLGDYIDGLGANQLKISFMNWSAKLTNLRVRGDAFYSFNLPIKINKGEVGEVSIVVNSLSPFHLMVNVDQVKVSCGPQRIFVNEKADVSIQRLKEKYLKKYKENENSDVMSGVELFISNIDFEYVDNGNVIMLKFEKIIMKNGLLVIVNTSLLHRNREMKKPTLLFTVPNVSVKLSTMAVAIPQVDVTFTRLGYLALMRMLSHFGHYSQQIKYLGIRPISSPKQEPKKWWKFAFEATRIKYTHTLFRKNLVDKIKNRYVSNYVDILMGRPIKPEQTKTMEVIEERLTSKEIAYLRKLATLRLNAEEELNKSSSFLDAFRNRVSLKPEELEVLYNTVDPELLGKKDGKGEMSGRVTELNFSFDGIGRTKVESVMWRGNVREGLFKIRSEIKNVVIMNEKIESVKFDFKFDPNCETDILMVLKASKIGLRVENNDLKNCINLLKIDKEDLMNIIDFQTMQMNEVLEWIIPENVYEKRPPNVGIEIETDDISFSVLVDTNEIKVSTAPIKVSSVKNEISVPFNLRISDGAFQNKIEGNTTIEIAENYDDALAKMYVKMLPVKVSMGMDTIKNVLQLLDGFFNTNDTTVIENDAFDEDEEIIFDEAENEKQVICRPDRAFSKNDLHKVQVTKLVTGGKRVFECIVELQNFELELYDGNNESLLRTTLHQIGVTFVLFQHYTLLQISLDTIKGFHGEHNILKTSEKFLSVQMIVSKNEELVSGLENEIKIGDVYFDLPATFLCQVVSFCLEVSALSLLKFPLKFSNLKNAKKAAEFFSVNKVNIQSLNLKYCELSAAVKNVSVDFKIDQFVECSFGIESINVNECIVPNGTKFLYISMQQNEEVTYLSVLSEPFTFTLRPDFIGKVLDGINEPDLWNIDFQRLIGNLPKIEIPKNIKAKKTLVEAKIGAPTFVIENEGKVVCMFDSIESTPIFENTLKHIVQLKNAKIHTNFSDILNIENITLSVENNDDNDFNFVELSSSPILSSINSVEFGVLTQIATNFMQQLGVEKVTKIKERIANFVSQFDLNTLTQKKTKTKVFIPKVLLEIYDPNPLVSVLFEEFNLNTEPQLKCSLQKCLVKDLTQHSKLFTSVVNSTGTFFELEQIGSELNINFSQMNVYIFPKFVVSVVKTIMKILPTIPHKEIEQIKSEFHFFSSPNSSVTQSETPHEIGTPVPQSTSQSMVSLKVVDIVYLFTGIERNSIQSSECSEDSLTEFTNEDIQVIRKRLVSGLVLEIPKIKATRIVEKIGLSYGMNETQIIFIIDYLIREKILSSDTVLYRNTSMYSLQYIQQRDKDKRIQVPLFSEAAKVEIVTKNVLLNIPLRVGVVVEDTETSPFLLAETNINIVLANSVVCNVSCDMFTGCAKNGEIVDADKMPIVSGCNLSCNLQSLVSGKVLAKFGDFVLSLGDIFLVKRVVEELTTIKDVVGVELDIPVKEEILPLNISVVVSPSEILLLHPKLFLPFMRTKFGGEILVRGTDKNTLLDAALSLKV
ncbi:hypothetical protein EIN_492350, partial [Entamoeba invadens IP1]